MVVKHPWELGRVVALWPFVTHFNSESVREIIG